MTDLLLLAAICFGITVVGAFIQRVSGFGFGIVVMVVFPFLFATFGEATALSGLLSILSTTYLSIRYRKSIRWRHLLWPLVAYIPFNLLAVQFVAGNDVRVLKMILGIFLVLLSVYFLLFSAKLTVQANPGTGLAAGGLSGLLGGGFAMAGPPIVVYLLAATGADKLAYIGTIQCYFAVTGCISTIGRVANGFLTQRVFILLPVALLAVLLGNFIGGKVYNQLNPAAIKRFVYLFMACAGVVIFLSTVL